MLDAGTTTANRTDYHRAMLAVLRVDAPSTALLEELEAPAAGPVVEFFPDVRAVLELAAIRQGHHGVALVRDGGPAPSSVPAITSLEELPPIVRGP